MKLKLKPNRFGYSDELNDRLHKILPKYKGNNLLKAIEVAFDSDGCSFEEAFQIVLDMKSEKPQLYGDAVALTIWDLGSNSGKDEARLLQKVRAFTELGDGCSLTCICDLVNFEGQKKDRAVLDTVVTRY